LKFTVTIFLKSNQNIEQIQAYKAVDCGKPSTKNAFGMTRGKVKEVYLNRQSGRMFWKKVFL